MSTSDENARTATGPTSPQELSGPLRAISPMTPVILGLKAMQTRCDCEVCAYLREIAEELARLPLRQTPPPQPGSQGEDQ